ncbi:unnamed protein product [Coffea canephora]|uniref:UBC core domain-containing protein n=1 Tax=Coffea canephora TaxID=49390 RepID=A0A068UG17_COFCA|nr:unnamed protein product [Coffea canephora]
MSIFFSSFICLQDKWSSAYDCRTILLSIQSLLGEPNNESPLNSSAAALWKNLASRSGLDTLKNLGQDMNEELDRQVPLIDEIDTKHAFAFMDFVLTSLLKLFQIRSSQNMRTDIILLCILLLGIAAYLYK